MKLKRSLSTDSTALTSVVLALLFLGLFAVTLTTIHTVYVPQWGEQHEGLHMREIGNQIAELKHSLDIQTITKDKTPIQTPFTLGTEQQLFLTTSRAYGSLHIQPEKMTFSLQNATNQTTTQLGTFRYSSNNNYYVDQSYIYEAGALFINQTEGYIITSYPPIIQNDPTYDLIITLFNLQTLGGKTDISGYGTYFVTTNYSQTQTYNYTNTTTIQITSTYPNGWYRIFNNTLTDLGFQYNNDYSLTKNENTITLNIQASAELNISLEIITFYAQISPGRIQ